MHFKKYKKYKKYKSIKNQQGGFTLLEMLTVIGIFGILTSIVIGSFGSFSNNTVLTNMAYEMGLSIREAQIYGTAVSSRDSVNNFDNKFGINFHLAGSESSVYHLYEDNDNSNTYSNTGTCISSVDVCQREYILQKGIKITKLQAGCGNSVDTLDVVFTRPNVEPYITGNATIAEITLQSREGDLRYVVVRGNGQIFVDNQSVCSSS